MGCPLLNNIFYLTSCWACENRKLETIAGRAVVAFCSETNRNLTDRNDIQTNGFPSWCPKKRQALIKGGLYGKDNDHD